MLGTLPDNTTETGKKMKKKTLHLTLKKKWFDLIRSGQKKKEFREGKQYWRRRLLDSEGFAINFDEVLFRNGYGAKAPWVLVEWKGLGVIGGSLDELWLDDHGEEVNNGDFVILLGNVLASGK